MTFCCSPATVSDSHLEVCEKLGVFFSVKRMNLPDWRTFRTGALRKLLGSGCLEWQFLTSGEFQNSLECHVFCILYFECKSFYVMQMLHSLEMTHKSGESFWELSGINALMALKNQECPFVVGIWSDEFCEWNVASLFGGLKLWVCNSCLSMSYYGASLWWGLVTQHSPTHTHTHTHTHTVFFFLSCIL